MPDRPLVISAPGPRRLDLILAPARLARLRSDYEVVECPATEVPALPEDVLARSIIRRLQAGRARDGGAEAVAAGDAELIAGAGRGHRFRSAGQERPLRPRNAPARQADLPNPGRDAKDRPDGPASGERCPARSCLPGGWPGH